MLAPRMKMAASNAGGAPWYRAGGAPAPLVVYQPIGAASLAASYTNLQSPGVNDATPGAAPSFSAVTGWGFSGTQWLDTGIIAPTLAGMSMFVLLTASGSAGVVAGVTQADDPEFQIRFRGSDVRYSNGSTVQIIPPITTQRTFAVAGAKAYRDGVDRGITLVPENTVNALTVNIGRLNRATPGIFFTGNVQAIAIYASTLTTAQVLAIHDESLLL